MGVISHDWGNMYAKFYHFRMFDKNLNMICDLWPAQQNGQSGIIDKCSNIFWTKTHLTGDFVLEQINYASQAQRAKTSQYIENKAKT